RQARGGPAGGRGAPTGARRPPPPPTTSGTDPPAAITAGSRARPPELSFPARARHRPQLKAEAVRDQAAHPISASRRGVPGGKVREGQLRQIGQTQRQIQENVTRRKAEIENRKTGLGRHRVEED